MTPTAGTLTYRGAPIQIISGRTGYMTQSDHHLPWRSVADNIPVPLEIRGMWKHAAFAWLLAYDPKTLPPRRRSTPRPPASGCEVVRLARKS